MHIILLFIKQAVYDRFDSGINQFWHFYRADISHIYTHPDCLRIAVDKRVQHLIQLIACLLQAICTFIVLFLLIESTQQLRADSTELRSTRQ
ncbi:hypothetical protein D3C86_1289040 [compost metagenome]